MRLYINTTIGYMLIVMRGIQYKIGPAVCAASLLQQAFQIHRSDSDLHRDYVKRQSLRKILEFGKVPNLSPF